ncbi:MAG: glycosyltransferase family 4 protein, partial [Candidatus Hydrogenedentes bacterium]|nr:glycosyltransferase family 4 protein [Candidatus Hydrogenedentota bacterium]
MILGIDGRYANMPRRAGVGNYSLGLLRGLARMASGENRVRVYLDTAPLPHFPSVPALEVRVLPRVSFWTHRALARELLHDPPDVYFSPLTQLPRRCPCPAIVTVHDLAFLDFPREFTWRRRALATFQTRDTMRRAAHLLADSHATRESVVRHFPAVQGRISVVYPACEPQFRPDISEAEKESVRRQLGLTAPYVLYVGRIQPRKNLVRLIEAFIAMKERTQLPHHLALAGDPGWLDKEIRAEAARHPACVRLLGFVDDAQLPALIAGADMLALVSLWAGFGLPALEALACGTPVLCSNTSALPEVTGDAALQVAPAGKAAISASMERLLQDDTLRAHLKMAGPARAALFSWDAAAAI